MEASVQSEQELLMSTMKRPMTIEQLAELPLLFRFAEEIVERSPSPVLRYDAIRQVSQVFENDKWVDSPDATSDPNRQSKTTFVESETTDDE